MGAPEDRIFTAQEVCEALGLSYEDAIRLAADVARYLEPDVVEWKGREMKVAQLRRRIDPVADFGFRYGESLGEKWLEELRDWNRAEASCCGKDEPS